MASVLPHGSGPLVRVVRRASTGRRRPERHVRNDAWGERSAHLFRKPVGGLDDTGAGSEKGDMNVTSLDITAAVAWRVAPR